MNQTLGALSLLVRDYARVDMRLTDTGDVYIIEVNSPCDLMQTSEFATGAKEAGLDYPALINRIVELAVERRKKTVPATNGKEPARKTKKATK